MHAAYLLEVEDVQLILDEFSLRLQQVSLNLTTFGVLPRAKSILDLVVLSNFVHFLDRVARALFDSCTVGPVFSWRHSETFPFFKRCLSTILWFFVRVPLYNLSLCCLQGHWLLARGAHSLVGAGAASSAGWLRWVSHVFWVVTERGVVHLGILVLGEAHRVAGPGLGSLGAEYLQSHSNCLF